VEPTPPLAWLDAHLADIATAGLGTATRAHPPLQGLTLIRQPQCLHARTWTAMEAFWLIAHLDMHAPICRRSADARRVAHAFELGEPVQAAAHHE
jgi:hypothetical protein